MAKLLNIGFGNVVNMDKGGCGGKSRCSAD